MADEVTQEQLDQYIDARVVAKVEELFAQFQASHILKDQELDLDKIDDSLPPDVKTSFKEWTSYTKFFMKKNQLMTDTVRRYVFVFLNQNSFKGYIDAIGYQNVYFEAIRGLNHIMFMIREFEEKDFEIDKETGFMVGASWKVPLCIATTNFITLLFSRIYLGRDSENEIRRLEASRSITYKGT